MIIKISRNYMVLSVSGISSGGDCISVEIKV
jgi:hypothetical protein